MVTNLTNVLNWKHIGLRTSVTPSDALLIESKRTEVIVFFFANLGVLKTKIFL